MAVTMPEVQVFLLLECICEHVWPQSASGNAGGRGNELGSHAKGPSGVRYQLSRGARSMYGSTVTGEREDSVRKQQLDLR